MASAGYPIVSRAGWPYILVTAGAAGLAQHFFGGWWAAPLWGAAIGVAALFRDPERAIPAAPLAVLSPADGYVLGVDKTVDPYLKRDSICIRIQMSVLGVYTTRSPVEGKVAQRWYTAHGGVGEADGGPGSPGEPRYGIWLRTDEHDDLVLSMVGGPRWRRPRCYVQYGERIGHGQRCGYICFGSRVDVFIAAGSRVAVRTGDRVRSGTSILATLIHK